MAWRYTTLHWLPSLPWTTLNRTLTFKEHCIKTKMKVQTRNDLLKKLLGTLWGARPNTMRTTGLALCFSAGEDACPVWSRSKHVKHVDIALNDTCQAIMWCLPTNTDKYIIVRQELSHLKLKGVYNYKFGKSKIVKRWKIPHVQVWN